MPEIPEEVSFNFDIRPILSDNCYVCHGPDPSTRQADLRLDLRETATLKRQGNIVAIVPGNWRRSELIRRVTSNDPEIMMPPPEMKKRLTGEEVQLLKKWISDGAEWEPYWAFQIPKAPKIPEVKEHGYINNTIDNFILSKLEINGLLPSELSNKSNLVRRLSNVITGLPPSPHMIREFERNPDPKAYEKMVDQLLDSPHYGERWARHWMDLVRYADSRGHEFDYPVIGAWRYRDYLIRAFNQDVPYDQLIREHLAGDLLDPYRINTEKGFNESILGTAFYCFTEGKHSPVDIRADEAERIDNIIDVTSKAFQALTVGCAKCHDHKFDPIPTTDYYSLFGIIESTRFTIIPVGQNDSKIEVINGLEADIKQLRSFITEDLAFSALEKPRDINALWFDAPPANVQVLGDFTKGDLQGWHSTGMAFGNALGKAIINSDRMMGWEMGKASSRIYGKGVDGALRSPTFIIENDSLCIRAAGRGSSIKVIIDNFQLIQDPIYGQLIIHPESDHMGEYLVDVSMWKGHKAYIELLAGNYGENEGKGWHTYHIDPDSWLEVEIAYAFDSLRYVPTTMHYKDFDPVEVARKWSDEYISPQEIAGLNALIRNVPLSASAKEIQRLIEEKQEHLYDSSFLVGVTEGDGIESPVFIRGSHHKMSDWKVPHRFFTAISDTSEVFGSPGSGRLELAEKIASPSNPLTARVMVNRIWHHVFGRGLVETVDNFGLQGKPPTHPELLDHLALRFIESGWSVKALLRYLVLSQTFQRSTNPYQESLEKDPQNLLLQHYPVRRLDAESIRDAILATSGRMDSTMYGPPIPIYLTEFLEGRGRPPKSGSLDGEGRRSIYQNLMRNFLPPMMLVFDMPIPFSTVGQRNVSNVPAQSLTMMNDPFVMGQAEYWGQRVAQMNRSFEEKVSEMYLKAFARYPTAEELQQAQNFFKGADFEHNNVQKWIDYCHTLFNMKEFVFLL